MHGEQTPIVHDHIGKKTLIPRDKFSRLQGLAELHFFHPIRLLWGILTVNGHEIEQPRTPLTIKQALDATRYPNKKKAVALRYDVTQDASPKVVAKGTGEIAAKIIALAKEHGIPLQEDADLVEILAKLDLNADIPPDTYLVVAEILAFIYRANTKMTHS